MSSGTPVVFSTFFSLIGGFLNKKNNIRHGVSTDAQCRSPLTFSRWKHQTHKKTDSPSKDLLKWSFLILLPSSLTLVLAYNFLDKNIFLFYMYLSFGFLGLFTCIFLIYMSIQFKKTDDESQSNINPKQKKNSQKPTMEAFFK